MVSSRTSTPSEAPAASTSKHSEMASSSDAAASPTPPETVSIDPNGDVLFEVGAKADPKVHLLVSSKVLSLASPVFAAMFKHGFQEGRNLSSGSLEPIPLPDDNAEAITLLFNVLHFRSRDVPWSPSLITLAHLAVVCDKYDCVAAVASWSTVWLTTKSDVLAGGKAHDAVMVLYVSYGLDVPAAFSEASLVLMRDHLQSTRLSLSLPSEIASELIPEHLADDIDRAREALYSKLDAAVAKGVEPLIEMGGLWCVRTRIGSYFTTLSNHSLWPPAALRRTSAQDALKKARAIIEPERGSMPCANSRCVCRSTVQPVKLPLGEALSATIKSSKGLCLDCVKTGAESARDRTCRVPHRDGLLT